MTLNKLYTIKSCKKLVESVKILSLLIIFSFAACNATDEKAQPVKNELAKKIVDTLIEKNILLKESFNAVDSAAPTNEMEELQPVRENFKRINASRKWTSIIKKDLLETAEGGEATYYYSGNDLEKITLRNYGETFQQLAEYYLLNGQLSFVFERSYRYNRPIYYDSAAMKANDDAETFDFNASEIAEVRSYFNHEKIILQLTKNKSPTAKQILLEEQKRIIKEYNQLKNY